jgi:acyl transferase domain-containing protein
VSASECLDRTIAIIGIGCRFPGGANSPATFWELLTRGGDGIIEVPRDRWNIDRFYDPNPAKAGKMYVRVGGFLTERIDQFDALFFGMSPREATYLDPQQRFLLEVAWEAIEDAGLVPERLAGSDTGVYIGAFMLDNLVTQLNPLNRDLIGTHTALGSTMSILSNRISYVFDFRGPSMSIDTACSSSLVALHQACQAIWRGECSLALAGGVNVMYRPETPISMCKGGFLSPDGRCKSFDARGDGYG